MKAPHGAFVVYGRRDGGNVRRTAQSGAPKLLRMQKRTMLLGVCAFLLTACAGDLPTAPTAAPAAVSIDSVEGMRVLVRVAADTAGGVPDENPAAIEARASAAAGVAVRYVAASGSQWHALVLQCKPGDCPQAVQRLAADRTRFPVVQPDESRRK
jgi:hypothetical protein